MAIQRACRGAFFKKLFDNWEEIQYNIGMLREIAEKIVEYLNKWMGQKTGIGDLKKTSPQVLPLDEQSFKKIRGKNFLYVDKTGFIAKLINSQSTYFFLFPLPFLGGPFPLLLRVSNFI